MSALDTKGLHKNSVPESDPVPAGRMEQSVGKPSKAATTTHGSEPAHGGSIYRPSAQRHCPRSSDRRRRGCRSSARWTRGGPRETLSETRGTHVGQAYMNASFIGIDFAKLERELLRMELA